MASQDRHRWRSCAQNTSPTARNDCPPLLGFSSLWRIREQIAKVASPWAGFVLAPHSRIKATVFRPLGAARDEPESGFEPLTCALRAASSGLLPPLTRSSLFLSVLLTGPRRADRETWRDQPGRRKGRFGGTEGGTVQRSVLTFESVQLWMPGGRPVRREHIFGGCCRSAEPGLPVQLSGGQFSERTGRRLAAVAVGRPEHRRRRVLPWPRTNPTRRGLLGGPLPALDVGLRPGLRGAAPRRRLEPEASLDVRPGGRRTAADLLAEDRPADAVGYQWLEDARVSLSDATTTCGSTRWGSISTATAPTASPGTATAYPPRSWIPSWPSCRSGSHARSCCARKEVGSRARSSLVTATFSSPVARRSAASSTASRR